MKTLSVKKRLEDIAKTVRSDKSIMRLHRENDFNKRYSLLERALGDMGVFEERITSESSKLSVLERKIQKCQSPKGEITERGQELRKEADKLSRLLQTDLKALYVFAKIFLDKYIQIISFILGDSAVKTRSINGLVGSLEKKTELPPLWKEFSDNQLENLKRLRGELVFYRDKFIEHERLNRKPLPWSVFHPSSGKFRFDTVSFGIHPKKTKKLKSLTDKYKEIPNLSENSNPREVRRIIKIAYSRLSEIPKDETRDKLEGLIVSLGVPSLTPGELLSLVEDFVEETSDFLIKRWPQIRKI